jgi:hypothetical protein
MRWIALLTLLAFAVATGATPSHHHGPERSPEICATCELRQTPVALDPGPVWSPSLHWVRVEPREPVLATRVVECLSRAPKHGPPSVG